MRGLAGLVDGHVGRMRIRTQTVEDGQVGVRAQLEGLLGHRPAIGVIGELHARRRLLEDQPQGGLIAVRQQRRTDDAAAGQHELRRHEVQAEGDIARGLRLADRVREDRLDALQPDLGRIDRDGRAALVGAELPEVVHAEHMVGMPVGEDERVDLPDVVLEALRAEFRRRVDLDMVPFDDHVDAGAGPPVTLVLQVQPRIVMGGQRTALRRAAAHDEDFHEAKKTRKAAEGKRRASPSIEYGVSSIGVMPGAPGGETLQVFTDETGSDRPPECP